MDEVAFVRKSTRAKLQGRLLRSTLASVLEAGSVWDHVADMLTGSFDDVCRKYQMQAAQKLWTWLLLGFRLDGQFAVLYDLDFHVFLQEYHVNRRRATAFWVFRVAYTRPCLGRLLDEIISWIGIDLPEALAGILKSRPVVQ